MFRCHRSLCGIVLQAPGFVYKTTEDFGKSLLVSIPSQIGQYRILRQIGTGGMGFVFVGEHALLGRRAAIKTLRPTMSVNQELAERFFNEARATSAISDPGVIQIFDFGYHVDGTAYIVMELLEGETLSTRIGRLGRLLLSDALRLARQIAGSLASAHASNIIHRDLKPDNVFLVRDPETQGGERTKLLDFGICKLGTGEGGLTQSGVVIGTPVYMSPEQCRGARDVDHRSDIYAFGCLVFHMITGRPPFVAEAPGDLIVAHLYEPPPRATRYVRELPADIDALLLRCLAKSPADRFASMTELQEAIDELSADLEVRGTAVVRADHALPRDRGCGAENDAPAWCDVGMSEPTHPLWSRPPLPLPPRTTGPRLPSAPRGTTTDAPPPRFTTRASLLADVPRPRGSLPLPPPADELSDPFAPPVMIGVSSELLSRGLSAVFRAVELDEATTVRPPTVAFPLDEATVKRRPRRSIAAPGPDDATNVRPRPATAVPRLAALGAASRVRRPRRAAFSNHLLLGCLVCVLAIPLEDGGATEANPATERVEVQPCLDADVLREILGERLRAHQREQPLAQRRFVSLDQLLEGTAVVVARAIDELGIARLAAGGSWKSHAF
jgi:serine/threonine protein kinase